MMTVLHFNTSKDLKRIAAAFLLVGSSLVAQAQGVSEIITDYKGYWKTSTAAVNAVKPDNHHNLLSFNYNGTRYSTGVNDALLTSNGQAFTPGVFRALPMQNINGAVTANTKIGLGAMIDGVNNGAGAAPSRSLGQYLNDGSNGLDLGTCVANLPAGSMFLSVSNLQASHIGDGIPDILVSQVADPSGKYDRYEFTDINGNRVGNYMDIVLTNITPVGEWVADFYEASGGTVLSSGFTQTSRNIRLWAADFSAFGINASNIGNIAYFKIGLSGDSDIAFVAYNTTTISVDQLLAIPSQNPRLQRNSSRDAVNTVSVFPNPAASFVNLSHPKAKGGEKVFVYNSQGVLMMQTNVSKSAVQTGLSIVSLVPGAYHVVFTNGYEKITEKLIVK